MEQTHVIIVDMNDHQIGTMDKIEAHRNAILHRAVSVFIFNSKGEWLLQRRALDKYHSNGLWTNTCCSHPFPGESNTDAANRRLLEEMGLRCELKELFSFTYNESLDNGLTEHEFDHVFFGITDEIPTININEAMDWSYISYEDLLFQINKIPNKYTVWFRKIYNQVHQHFLIYNTVC